MNAQAQMMTVREVAEHLNIGVSTVWRSVAKGTLPAPIKIGGSTRWRRVEIEAITSVPEAA